MKENRKQSIDDNDFYRGGSVESATVSREVYAPRWIRRGVNRSPGWFLAMTAGVGASIALLVALTTWSVSGTDITAAVAGTLAGVVVFGASLAAGQAGWMIGTDEI